MNKLYLIIASLFLITVSCKQNVTQDAHGQDNEASGIEPLAFTLYSDKTELFVEFKPLIVGQKTSFAAHFTILGEDFLPVTTGSVTLSLVVGDSGIKTTTDSISSPGIFRLFLSPTKTGAGKLVFDINTGVYTDQIIIDNIKVYSNEAEVKLNPPTPAAIGDITYPKEQAWKVEFANEELTSKSFNGVIKTSGKITTSPGDESMLATQIDGAVSFVTTNLTLGKYVTKGTTMFRVKNNTLVESSVNAEVKSAEDNLRAALVAFDRASELIKDKIIAQREYNEAKLKLDNAKTSLNRVKATRGFYSNNQSIITPISGYVTKINISQGEIVKAGQTLATISTNKKLILQANVSQQYFSKLSSISDANFKIQGDDKVYSIKELNGKLLTFGKSTSENQLFIPVTFEVDNNNEFVAGSLVEVFLKTKSSTQSLVVPTSALIEEQGNFYVYVQVSGESFLKKEIELGANDGKYHEVKSGLKQGDRIVTKGGFQIKLASAAGTLPAHGHEH